MSSLLRFPKRSRRVQPNPQQSQSPLFSALPTELRLQIFALVLECFPITLTVVQYGDRPHMRIWERIVGSTTRYTIFASRLLSLLLSCARAYNEALLLLYSLNVFYVRDHEIIQ
ncbi:hypothetical protein F5Y03DRAFT_350655 [Xylaria venustula]|nr:hypothetical protein F5Y03DRAFT_350655 [Xylaria venustula]